MTNWKLASDYAFTQKLDRAGWVWEFLRRNPKYRLDFERATKEQAKLMKTYLAGGLPPHVAFSSASAADGRTPLAAAAQVWWMESPIRDPSSDRAPHFLVPTFPTLPNWDEVKDYFQRKEVNGAETAVQQRDGYAVVVFNLARPMKSQFEIATRRLMRMQKGIPKLKSKKSKTKEWTRFLRLLDAKAAHASTQMIIKAMPKDYNLPNLAENKYQMTDRVTDHLRAARALRDNPFVLLT
jgi:hypothetical protein